MSKIFYVTTAIDYVNGQPHLGHAYEKVITDVIARARRSLGEEVFFLTGLDEHGQKVQQAAQAEGRDPQAYCDGLAESWQALALKLGLTNSDFVRTTEPRHKQVVQALLSKMHAEGHFYKAVYKGFYSLTAESFLTEKDRLPDGSFDASWGKVIELEEENYYFKLKDHQQWLIDYLEANPDFVAPTSRRNEILGFLKNNELEDLCITRPSSRLNWGIPIPFDPAFVTYVWFDALVNYISVPAAHGDPGVNAVLGKTTNGPTLWPADIHVIGKDILKFHAVYWPIMLKKMGLPLPKQILTHGWWQKDGQKMSKTTGNVVDPIAVIDENGLDAFRYYVVRELDIGPDGNWTDAGFKTRYDSELASGLGNLLNRSLTMLKKYRNGIVPRANNQLTADISLCREKVIESYRKNQLQDALNHITELRWKADQFIEKTSPFKMAKDPAKAAELDSVLYSLVETCRAISVFLWPIIPNAAEKMQAQLGVKLVTSLIAPLEPLADGHVIGEVFALFPRKEEPKKTGPA